jgi:dTDP-4-amino-4,6-dideoxygalactose transaminase
MKKTIAVIGTGYWGKNLVRNFAELGALRVICDTDKDKLDHFKTKYTEILTTTSFKEILKNHHVIGYNSRLDTIQAAILAVKLNHLEEWTDRRRANAMFYNKALGDINDDNLEIPQIAKGRKHIFNQYTVRVKNGKRDKLKEFLEEQGIDAVIYYPLSLHLQPCFSFLGYRKGDFASAEKASAEVLSLPVYPELKEEERE